VLHRDEPETFVAERAAVQRTATPDLNAKTEVIRPSKTGRILAPIAIVIVLLLIGGVGFLVSRNSASSSPTTTASAAITNSPEISAGLASNTAIPPTFVPLETRAAATLARMQTLTSITASSFTQTPDLSAEHTLGAIVKATKTAIALASATKTPTATPTPTRHLGLKIAVIKRQRAINDAQAAETLQGAQEGRTSSKWIY